VPDAEMRTVTVGVLTFRRPEGLAVSLPRILEQIEQVNGNSSLGISASLLVVDNDRLGSAEKAVRAISGGIRYAVEPLAGISNARNRALDEAQDSDALVFIDDDEHPHPGWLISLLDVWRSSGASAVMGRVTSEFEVEPDDWVKAGEFFRRRSMASGTPVRIAAAGNLLLDIAQLRDMGVRFDGRLGLSGGEDTLLSLSIERAGGRVVWCEESVATDRVPANRLSRSWLRARSFHKGNAEVLVRVLHARSGAERALVRGVAFFGGLGRCVVGRTRTLVGGMTHSVRHEALGEKLAERGRGMVAASLGRSRPQYTRDED
jgi:succinoglycan biosynthesis protein ExoM